MRHYHTMVLDGIASLAVNFFLTLCEKPKRLAVAKMVN